MASTIRRGARALVTGARTGLGHAFAAAFADAGLHVTATSRSAGAGFPTLPRGVKPLHLDFTDAGVERFIEEHGALLDGVDVLVNNAGAGVFGPFEGVGPNAFRMQMESLAVAPLRLAQRVFPLMRARGAGAIVNVSSLAAESPIPFMAPYNAAKAALTQGTRSLMLEARGTGVQVVDFQPGDHDTGFNAAMERVGGSADGRTDRVWAMLEHHLRAGPPPETAARVLLRALRRGRSGTVRCGGWAQVFGASFVRRFFGDRFMRRLLARYYRLEG